MSRHVVLAFDIKYFNGLILIYKQALVADLSAHFSIEWRMVQNNLVENFFLLFHLAVAQDAA